MQARVLAPSVRMFRSCVRQNGGYAVLIAIAINRRRHIPSEICTSYNAISNISNLLWCWFLLTLTLLYIEKYGA